MKKKNLASEILIILIAPLGAYIGFYQNISCTPGQAGFWIVLTLGMSIGVALVMFFQHLRQKRTRK